MTTRKRHIRRPDLPWRQATHTVCGRTTSTVTYCESVAELKAVPREDRFAMRGLFCETCKSMYAGWPEWDADPVARMERECEPWSDKRRRVVELELRALAELVARHRAEFDELIEGEQALAALAGFR